VRIDTAGTAGVRDLLPRVRDRVRAVCDRGAVPFERIVADLNPAREPGRNPIFDVAINYLPPAEKWQLGRLAVEPLDPPRSIPAPFEVMWRFIERGGGLHLRVEYRAGRFREARVAGWLERFLDGLAAAAGQERRRP
jgi:hypothetical protein